MPEDPQKQVALSVQDRTEEAFSLEAPLTIFFAQWADDMPAYPSKERDIALGEFWPKEPILAGAVYSMIAKVAALDFRLIGRQKAVTRYKNILLSSDFGAGWVTFAQKIVQDLLTQDNGCMIELLRAPGAGATSPVLGVAALDAQRCLGRDSRVRLAYDCTEPIEKIVKYRHPGPVACISADGKIEYKPIVGWHKTDLGERYWLRVECALAVRKSRGIEGLWVTNDHEFLTPTGYVRADRLVYGDSIATGFHSPSREQGEILVGILLGDGHLRRNSPAGWPVLELGHSTKQEEWLDYQKTALTFLEWQDKRYQNTENSHLATYASRTHPALDAWHRAWYDQDRKQYLSRELFSQYFSPRMLAVWYGDDGSLQTGKWGRPRARFYTNNFAQADVEWMASYLSAHGYKTFCRSVREGQWYLYVTADGAEQLFMDIAPYMPACMRYKLPAGSPLCDAQLWKSSPVLFYDTVRSVSAGSNATQTAAYCIDVADNSNFVAGGMVVHNCRRTGNPEYPVVYTPRNYRTKARKLEWWRVLAMADMPSPREQHKGVGYCAISRVLRAAQLLRDVGIYKREKLSGKRVPALLFVQGARRGAVKQAITEALEEQRSEGASLYTGPVILASPDPGLPLDAKLIELAGLPDGYNEDVTLKWYIATLALGFGTDYTEFAPLPGGGLGSGSQTAEMAARARGKGPGVLLQQLEFGINWFVLPSSVTFQFASTDPTAEQQRIELAHARARERALRIQSGEITPEQGLILAVQAGDAPDAFLQQPDTDPYDQQVDVMVKAVGNLQRAVEWVETRLTYGSA